MSSDKKWILSRVPCGRGRALDLGGGNGELAERVEALGYASVNLDLEPSGAGPSVVADAHALPFSDGTFELVLSSDSLEHLKAPHVALREVRRVLTGGGKMVIWVPFLHPFHSSDYYRYTPLGLRHLLSSAELEVLSIESPLWIFTVLATACVTLLKRVGLGSLEGPISKTAAWLDLHSQRFQGSNRSFATFYLVSARKPEQRK